jgi:hypothetical protein
MTISVFTSSAWCVVTNNESIWRFIYILFLALSALVAAKAGGSNRGKAVLRICFWGPVAMFMTALVGYFFCGKNCVSRNQAKE